MSGITSGTGIFSGINSAQIIDQLLALEARPRTLAQQRVSQLQRQQAAYLDLNAKMAALRTASGNFRTNRIFDSASAASSDSDVLTATARAGAATGSYQFLVDRLVSSQQVLSRGFAAGAGVNAGTFTFESAAARLDRDTNLAELNGGTGVSRGKIVISSSAGGSATIDLSRAATVGEVLETINGATGVGVRASVENGRFVLQSTDGSNLTVANASGSTTADSLGIRTTTAAATVNGTVVYRLAAGTALSSLNDGNGVFRNSITGEGRFDFQVVVGSTTVNVNIGDKYNAQGQITEAAPTSVGGVLTRINDALKAALGNEDMKAAISADGSGITIADSQNRSFEVKENPTAAGSTTARDLGLLTTAPVTGTLTGKRVLAGMNSTLVGLLNGGQGVAGNGQISITGRDGQSYTVNIDTNGSLTDAVAAFAAGTGGKITAALNRNGTGLVITDATGGTGNLIISGQSAESLKIATAPAGVASATVDSGSLQRQYITRQTTLASLRSGQGVGTGAFRITDSTGATAEVSIDSSAKTLDDVIRNINSRSTLVRARINANGDGLELFEEGPGSGALKIKVEDSSGNVAQNLNIRGEAAGTGAQNVIDGSFERRVTFAASDGLAEVATKINAANAGVTAAVINDGTTGTPLRLSLTARSGGSSGRFVIDSGALDLGLSTIEAGRDAKVFFGSTDPARAVLLTSQRNTLDGVVANVSIDLKATSATPVTLTVSTDTAKIEENVGTWISAFNSLVDSIDRQTKANEVATQRGPLLGDSTANSMRAELFAVVNGRAANVSGPFQRLADVGVTVGRGGDLELNAERLRTALAQDPDAVERLFAAREVAANAPTVVAPGATVNNANQPVRFTSQGIATLLENMGERYLNSVDGRLTQRDKSIRDQISLQTQRIGALTTRLESRRQILQAQFTRMEEAIGKLQQQSASLGQIGAAR